MVDRKSLKLPAVLIVRDGWGRNPNSEHDAFNAIKLASTPVCDRLLEQYPWTLIATSGEDVGLPESTMGNSEVGHQNLGAGRIVDQESVRITKAIRDGSFFENPTLVKAVEAARDGGGCVHLLGIASDAGVHGLMTHLYACIELCKRLGQERVALHLFTDGRDTGPFTGLEFVRRIEEKCRELGVGRVASICGRYYAMDRDNRWERVQKAYACLTGHAGDQSGIPMAESAQEAIQRYYDNPTTSSQNGDEFIVPTMVGASRDQAMADRIGDGDTIIFYNYRGDRPRQITRAFVLPDEQWAKVKPSPDSGKSGFERGGRLDLRYVTLTAYEEALGRHVQVAYPKPPRMENIVGQFISQSGLTQFRCAETEKFPHVTFFFNDYREEPWPGEVHQMAQSPKVATYDLQPEMSAGEVCRLVVDRLEADDGEDVIIVNFANGDMVGHTGSLEAAIKAVETVDGCVGEILKAVAKRGGIAIVTADHGNAEQMFDPQTNAAHTAHTLYPVECILVDDRLKDQADGQAEQPSRNLRRDGRLADVLPTLLKMIGLEPPREMTGRSLCPND
ncbi:MAG: 2,3-bisphosphoglycerate-independent phosphoglycerate mutase [Phycisphaeraceae bacterium]|nr:2,3-bisphosphoglycerate-independent phosphoglycerate mutase [Phycisphaeraceae bacterium]